MKDLNWIAFKSEPYPGYQSFYLKFEVYYLVKQVSGNNAPGAVYNAYISFFLLPSTHGHPKNYYYGGENFEGNLMANYEDLNSEEYKNQEKTFIKEIRARYMKDLLLKLSLMNDLLALDL